MRKSPIAGLAAFAVATLVAPLALAQTINLNTGFMPDPQRFQGMAGGPVSAQTVQADCRGWIPAQPSYILQSPTGFRFLRIFAESSTDTTLMVRGVNQTWCADDTYGNMPGLDLRGLPPGRYDVYVGTYSQGQTAPFQLALSELTSSRPTGAVGTPNVPQPPYQPPVPNPPQLPSLGNLDPTLRAVGRPLNIPPNVLRPVAAMGRTNGVFDAGNVRGEGTCRGWVQAAPSHTMLVRTPQPFLLVAVTSAADSTLIIRRPDGTLVCNDDRFNLNPGVQGAFPAGIYQMWVGSYRQGEVRPYRITVSSDPTVHP